MDMRAILIVRLGALGDIIHALPVAAALRARFGDARIDWVVDERHRELLELVPIVDRRIVLRTRSASLRRGVTELRRALTGESYDVAIDVQGLLKSAVVARLSGARRILGFTPPHLRERAARVFYTETHDPGDTAHVIEKNLTFAAALGADVSRIRFSAGGPRLGGARRRSRPPLGGRRQLFCRAQPRRRLAEQALATRPLRRDRAVAPPGARDELHRHLGPRR